MLKKLYLWFFDKFLMCKCSGGPTWVVKGGYLRCDSCGKYAYWRKEQENG